MILQIPYKGEIFIKCLERTLSACRKAGYKMLYRNQGGLA